MEELDPRKKSILQAVVIEYVTGAEPVGSELLVQKYGLGVKSATVRNELAEMSELGYLEQPHTSAGRIPSDRGYRYYVDRLVIERDLHQTTKQRLRDVTKDGDALQALLRDTVRLVSRVTQLLTVATTVRDRNLTVRSALLSALGPSQALAVLVLNNGHVENRIVECPAGLTLQDIGKANELLASLAVGSTLTNLSKMTAPTGMGSPAGERLMGTLWTHVRAMARVLTRGQMITEGEEFMFAQPEFQRDVSSLTQMLEDLMESDVLYNALSTPAEAGPRTVTIGKEHRDSQMHQLSVVRQTFFVGDQEAGVIALIGPTRMKYDSSLPLVNYTAQALSESLTRFFG